MRIRLRAGSGSSSSGRRSLVWVGLLFIITSGLLSSSCVAARSSPSSSNSSTKDTCVVGEWGPFTPCTRTGLHRWAHSHSRSVQLPASDCPALVETQTCEASSAQQPADAAIAAQQVATGILVNLPLAVSTGISFPQAAADRAEQLHVTPELAAALAEGRQLWHQQASHTDQLQCSPFNGPAQLLRDAASPVVGTQSLPAALSTQQLVAARAAFAATAKAVAVQAAAAARSRAAHTGSSSSSSALDAFRKAVLLPTDPSQGDSKDGTLPDPVADATADVSWDGGSSITVALTPGPAMGAAAAHTAAEALQDGMGSTVPWLSIKGASSAAGQRQPTSARRAGNAMHLNMTYGHSQRTATFNAVPVPATGLIPSHGMLLLSIQHVLTGIYGLNLDLDSSSKEPGVLDLPVTDAMLRATAGGGVDQLAVSLAGTWTQANLTAAMGLTRTQRRPQRLRQQQQQQQQQDKASFTIKEPAVLYSAMPAALYVAVQTNVPSLAVADAPATINLRPGGAAALTLFEPCEPVSGLQLTDVQLHLEPEGNLTGTATGTVASTAVSALATVTPSAETGASAAAGAASAGQDLAMVMTAETVGAGNLAEVITIITRPNRKQPAALLQTLRRQQEQQAQQQEERMQFSSVTLTYNSPKMRRRGHGNSQAVESDDGGFNMVAVPDVNAAPALKQMLDAIGLSQDSLTLRSSSASSVGSAFSLAAEQPYTLQLPAPFEGMGPTVLTLEYNRQSLDGRRDTLITTALAGSSTAGLQLPGSSSRVALDLSAVKITTPTAIVGAQGRVPRAAAANDVVAQVTADVSGRVLSPVSLDGLSFLSFGAMNVSGRASYAPMALQDLELSGPLTAFGVAGTASFTSSSVGGGGGGDGVVVQPQQDQAGAPAVQLSAFVPSVDLPLMAQSLGANMSLGVLSANIKAVRAQFSTAEQRKQENSKARRARTAQDNAGPLSLSVSGELQLLGMSSYVAFDMSGEQGASIAASFVAGQIDRVLMPSLLSAVAASLQTTRNTVQSAAAAAASASPESRQVGLQSLLTDAQAALKRAQQQLDGATATLNTANRQVTSRLSQAAATAESATAAYNTARSQSGAALEQARNELNTADTAFNQAKTLAYKNLNSAQQAYKEALAAHEAVVSTAQERVDTLVAQTLQLRAAYNAANLLCNPTAEGMEHCKTAASAWVSYQSASSTLDSAETALQEAAVAGTSALKLDAAKASFAAQQEAANDAVTGEIWSAWVAASARLDAATAAVAEAERGQVAAQMQAANTELSTAQEASRTLLSPAAAEWKAVQDAKHALRAARAGVRAATAAARLTTDELSAASADLNSLLAAVQGQIAALSRADTAPATGPAQAKQLVRFERVSVGVTLTPGPDPVLVGVSYSGAVGSGDQQQALSGRFMVDASAADSEELGLMLSEVLRDDALTGLRKAYRSLSALL